jgi:hypothetical protein
VDVIRRLAAGADDLFVALVTDQQDVVVGGGEPLRLVVHLRHQRAGRVDRLELPRGRLLVHHRGDTVCGEDHRLALGHLVGLVDEDRAARLQGLDDVLVVHDLLAHVDRRTVQVERLLHRDHRPVHAGAVPPRRGEQHPLRLHGGRTSGLRLGSHAPHRTGPTEPARTPVAQLTLTGEEVGEPPALSGRLP